ncbi:putative glutamate carboxypeptidase [Colletotrichum sp. SAR11_59]|nr:putative glutamate carboxypeptidase [Colletotrichum sp. SAR11_59]
MEIKVTQQEAEQLMLETPTTANLRHWSKEYSAEPHLAGDLAHATRIRDLWRSYGIPTELEQYDVLQNFPVSQSLQLLDSDGPVAFEASLTEDEIPEDPTSSPKNGLPAFHGFSANGEACAELVYANFGELRDFELLESKGISVKGKIAICKYAKVFRGLKVRAAEQYGADAVILYNDPQEDGHYTEANGYKSFPHGPARHPKSIQRGSVDFFSIAVGDPTTPGYPSLPGNDVERQDPGHATPKIPSLPISYADAVPFLKALNGQGLSPFSMGGEGSDWKGCLADIDYFTGPSKVRVSLANHGKGPFLSEMGITTIPGVAVPSTLILANWDNEEYGLVGSTEWGEHHQEELSKNCVAYLNVDEATNGGQVLGVTGSPLLASVLRDVTQLIRSPIHEGKTVYDDWLGDQRRTDPGRPTPVLDLMGTGSDYTVFFNHLGIPSVDLLFNRQGQGVYPYHSNYDSFYWVEKFGDVGFKKHRAMAQLWGLLTVRLAGTGSILFEAGEYPKVLAHHSKQLKTKYGSFLDLSALEGAISQFHAAALEVDARSNTKASPPNLQPDGDIFAPGLWYGYDGVIFPGVVECMEAEDMKGATEWIAKIVKVIEKVTRLLLINTGV